MNSSIAVMLHLSCRAIAVCPICIPETGTQSVVRGDGRKNQKSESGSWNLETSLGNACLYLLGCLVMKCVCVCCWHWVVSLQQCTQMWWSCTRHSAATVSRQNDGDDGIRVYVYVPGVCVRMEVGGLSLCMSSREMRCCFSFDRFLHCLSFFLFYFTVTF